MSLPLLSIVIPAFNEERRLAESLRTLHSYFQNQGFSIELIVVEDGSTDATGEVALQTAESVPGMQLLLLQNPRNMGKGQSVRRGMLQARGDYTLLTDADLSTPVEEFQKLFDVLTTNRAHIAIGSRDLPDSDVQIRQSQVRERSGKIFNLLVRLLFGISFRDTQCGFKIFRTEICRSLFEKQTVWRFSFDVEILVMAREAGLGVVEVPVVWRHDRGSRVRFFQDGSRMILDLGRMAFKYWGGSYRRQLSRKELE